MRGLTSGILRLCAQLSILLFFGISVPGAAAETIRMRVTEFAPNYFQRDGRWMGLDVELAEAIVHEAGFEIEFRDLPWSRALSYMKSGDLDIMANLSRTPEREAFMLFIGPERLSTRVLVVKAENVNLPIKNLDDLVSVSRQQNKPFGIQADAKYSPEFDARLANDKAFAEVLDPVSQGALLPRKLMAGHDLGFFEDSNYAAYQLKYSPDFKGLAIHPFTLASDPVFLGVRKSLNPALAKKLEDAYQKLERNGTLEKIRMRWSAIER
ncbi:MAG: amino acid ABC transporter substrate-binding protein [Burkholderiaceae bacterium]|nr:amino acid ABC transporter substrate-binding protein [Burkholderiaceae bacterium]